MISRERVLKVTCPKCGAAPGAFCMFGSRGKQFQAQHPQRIGRALQERDFWQWVDERLSDPSFAGTTEQQLLDSIRIPGWMGLKARNNAPVRKVLSMPARDFRMAAAGDDSDDAA